MNKRILKNSIGLLVALLATLAISSNTFAQGKGKPGGGGGDDPEPAASYEVVALDDASGRYTDAWARDINDSGTVVGSAEDPGSAWVATCWTTAYVEGQLTTQLKVLDGGTGGMAYGINNRGQIVGVGLDSSSNDLGLYWPSAAEAPLTLSPLPEHSISWARGINENGVICGNSVSQRPSPEVPVIWRVGVDVNGKPKISGPFELPTLGLDGSTSAINTRGNGFADVVGQLIIRDEDGNDIAAAVRWSLQLLTDGTIAVDDPVVLDFQAEAYGANDDGVICGFSGFPSEATVWSGSQSTFLPSASDVLGANANDLNNDGTVVGVAAFLVSKRGVDSSVDRAVVWPSDSRDMVNLNSFLSKRSALESLQRAEAVNAHGEIVGDAGVGAFIAVPK